MSEVIYRDFKHETKVESPKGRLLKLQTLVCTLELSGLGYSIALSRMCGNKNLIMTSDSPNQILANFR